MIGRIKSSVVSRARAGVRRLDQRLRGLDQPRAEPVVTKFERFERAVDRMVGGLAGKRLLEIGSDSDAKFLHRAVDHGNVALAVGVNPALVTNSESGGIRLLTDDARSVPYPDGSFDVITAMSVFEHIFSLDEVLEESYRLLAPGGFLITEFAPIWSGCWGHHLYLHHGGRVVDWNSHPLPPYAHLLMEPAELEAWCTKRWADGELSRKIVQYVFHSTEQNRMFYSDYIDVMEASPLDLVFTGAFADVPFPPQVPECDYPATFAKLRARYPDKSGWGHQGMIAMLSKTRSAR